MFAHWKGLAPGCFGSFQASVPVPQQPWYHLRCPLHSLSGRGRWSFPTCSATPPPSYHLLYQPPKLPLGSEFLATTQTCPHTPTSIDAMPPALHPSWPAGHLSSKFHHEDCVQLSRDRLNFCLQLCVRDRQSWRCCCIQLSSPTDQLAPSLKLENPLWPMFIVSRVRNKLEFSPRVDHRHCHTVSIHRDSAITRLRYHVLIVDWGWSWDKCNKTTGCVRSDFILTQRGLQMNTWWTKCNAHESARST